VSRITVPHVTAARDALVVYATPWTPPAEAATVGP
jgi:O-glycosyl hydrolase